MLKDGIVHYGKARYKVVERLETMDRIHKGQTRCTGREERVMWAALLFPLGFDEIALIWDTERDKSRRTNITPPYFIHPRMRKITRKHIQQFRFK